MGCLCDQMENNLSATHTCIGHLWIFESLKPEELGALVRAAWRKVYKRGQEVFSQGGRINKMFLIKGGRVKLSKITEVGDELILDIRKAGDFLGENMLLEDTHYPLSATCLQDSLVCGFAKQDFERLVLDHPSIGLQVIKNLSARIDWLTSRVGSLSFTNLEDRLYSVLMQFAQEHGIKSQKGSAIQFPLTHEELGFLVGAHRVSITRAMKALKESGKIIQEGRTLILA